ncbi:MAG: hypothetical protein WBN28_13330, partial [Lutimonas sp.]
TLNGYCFNGGVFEKLARRTELSEEQVKTGQFVEGSHYVILVAGFLRYRSTRSRKILPFICPCITVVVVVISL